MIMRELLTEFTDEYILKAETTQVGKDERRIINNPICYLFIGDQSLPALKAIYKMNQRKWANHEGIIYIHVYLEETWQEKNVYSFKAVDEYEAGKRIRPSIYERFYQNESKLIEYNQLLRQVNVRFSELGVMFNSFQKVHLSMVTPIVDPLTILSAELTILLENSCQELFTMHYLDAFCLVEERGIVEDEAAFGISFLEELRVLQRDEYVFTADIHVTKDNIRMPVTRYSGRLFDLVYILGDKDERGLFAPNGMVKNYEIISTIVMMKNKLVSEHQHFTGNESYNNVQFSKNSQDDEGNPVFVTAGFSKVSRPNKAIAINVLYYFYQYLIKVIRERTTKMETDAILRLLELDEFSIERRTESILPSEDKLEEMLVLMPTSTTFSQVKMQTLKEVEDTFFGKSAKLFFAENYETFLNEDRQLAGKRLKQLLSKRVVEQPGYGIYTAYQWTDDSMIQRLLKQKAGYVNQISNQTIELEKVYEELGIHQKFKKNLFSEKTTTRQFISHFLLKIYRMKWQILRNRLNLNTVNMYIDVLETSNQEFEEQIKTLEILENTLREQAEQVITGYQSKINQNIPEYYQRVVELILRDIVETRSTEIFFDESNLGNYSLSLNNGTFLRRVLTMCHKMIFESARLDHTFEDEILARGNIMVSYGDPVVLTKEELFSEIYQLLDKDSACQVHLLEYNQKHRYEENYYFGDYESSFIQFALSMDTNLPYRHGCIHERRTSGIEKLHLMGGFLIEDLRFYQSNYRYYEKYQENGFEFHPDAASITP